MHTDIDGDQESLEDVLTDADNTKYWIILQVLLAQGFLFFLLQIGLSNAKEIPDPFDFIFIALCILLVITKSSNFFSFLQGSELLH